MNASPEDGGRCHRRYYRACERRASVLAQNVGIATSNPGSLFHNIGTAVANAANEGGLNTTIQPATSPNQFIPFVDQGGIEFGVANLQEVNYAITGEAWWDGQHEPEHPRGGASDAAGRGDFRPCRQRYNVGVQT